MFQMKVIFFLAVEKIYCWHSSVIFTYFHIYEFYDNIAKLTLFFFWLIHFFHLIWLPKTLWQMAALHISKYIYHSVKSGQIRSYFWSVFSCIRIRNNSVFGHFSPSVSQDSPKHDKQCNSAVHCFNSNANNISWWYPFCIILGNFVFIFLLVLIIWYS